jgi:flagellar P-ring protein precursor FlgI
MHLRADRVSLRNVFFLLSFWLFLSQATLAQDVRIKDLVHVRGVRTNQLVGFGLVVGLSNSGDSRKSIATNKATATMLSKLGMATRPEDVSSGSVAGVIVTAELPVFSRNGDRIDVKISTIGDAKSLAGGTLLMTPLRAGDGQVWVVASGSVAVGQASGSGPQVLTVAAVPGGGVVERDHAPAFAPSGKIILSLRDPDFTTNSRLVDAVNSHFREFVARSLDPATIEVTVPEIWTDRTVEFQAELEGLRVRVDRRAVVVLNERTGTVVMGADVSISSVAISHGSLSIQVGGKKGADQGVVNVSGTTVGKLVETLNNLGVRPADLVGIVQALRASGALQADIKFL